MSHPVPAQAASSYELRIDGHLDGHWSAWFGARTLTRNDDGTTTLCGPLIDQSDLHGLLAKVRDLGATLVSVHVVDGVDPIPVAWPPVDLTVEPAEPPACQPLS